MSDELTFVQVREANMSRAGRWHPGFPFDSDWNGADWANAMQGEIGEVGEVFQSLVIAAGKGGNIVKKLRRYECGLRGEGDPNHVDLLIMLGEEIADVYLYLDLLATYFGLDMPAAVIRKFNIVSERQGFPERLP